MKFLVDQETTVFVRKCMLKAAEDVEKRSVTLHIALLLNAELVKSAPKFIQESFRAVRSVETGILKAELSKDIELQTIEFYPDPRVRKDAFRTQSAHLTSLTIEREESPDGADKIMLHFQVVQPLEKHLHSWVYDTLGQKVFAKFYETQGELDLAEAEATQPNKGAKSAAKGGKAN